ncbi:MAG: cell wall hydrolase [Hyphomonadaceae bacterium]
MTVEMERNPLVVRQGAAAVACIAAAAVAMPVIAHRAAEQRGGAETAQAVKLETPLGSDLFARAEPAARLELVTMRNGDGLRARGSAPLLSDGADTHALLVQAALRGPLADTAAATPDKAANARDLRCLSEAVYYEARGESRRGQEAVAEVVMNRVRSGFYPGSVCGVVYQGSARATGCQFTFTCDGSLDRRPRGAAWAEAQSVAREVMLGYARPLTGRATHYHTTAVDPRWSSMLVETGRIGEHIFYRFPNRAERARLLQEAALRAPAAAAADEIDDAAEVEGVEIAPPPLAAAAAAPAPTPVRAAAVKPEGPPAQPAAPAPAAAPQNDISA